MKHFNALFFFNRCRCLVLLLLVAACCIMPPVVYAQQVASQKQTIKIKGQVLDSRGITLPGVKVSVKGTGIMEVTNTNGEFALTVPYENTVLVFSYVGMVTQQITVSNNRVFRVVMKDANENLNEVVVVGYGSVKRKDITGSVGEANMQDIDKAPVATFDAALAGRIAGVNVSSSDGQPGDNSNIVIRGGNSLTQNNSPLYVVDGFPLENYASSSLSPDDIESINVLKDASATAIYGSRGANGVIVIETKKGKNGAPQINYKGSIGYQQVVKKMPMMDSYDFVKYQLELNPAAAQSQYLDPLSLTLDSYRNEPTYSAQDEALRNPLTYLHNLSIRGGNAGTKYSISGSADNQDGVIINSNYSRYLGRVSIDQTISNKIKVGVTTGLSHLITSGSPLSQGISVSMLGYAMYNLWAYRPVNGTGTDIGDEMYDDDPQNTGSFLRINPITNLQNELNRTTNNDVNVNSYLTYEIIPGLTLKITGGINSRKTQNQYFYNSSTTRGNPLNPNALGVYGGIRNGTSSSWLNENTLTYIRNFNKDNRLDVLVGATLQKNNTNEFDMQAIKIPNEQLGISALASGTPYTNVSSQSLNTLESFLGRVNYSFKSRYLLTFTMRADGSSKFPPANRWGYFPSGAFAWRIKDESFLKENKIISDAKIRTSYGVTGNNRVSDFGYLPNLVANDTYGYTYGNAALTQGVVYGTVGNSLLRWESTAQLDIGIDVSVLNNRIVLTADVYKKNTSGLLLNASLPRTTGFTNILENIGKIQNKGLEITLNTTNIKNKDFEWSSNFNISFNRNKILSLVNGQNDLLSAVSWDNFYTTPLYDAQVGKPAALFYGYVWEGNYQYSDFDQPSPGVYVLKSSVPTNESSRPAVSKVQPGDIKYKDINGDGVITAADQTIIGNPQPLHTGGFSNDFTYKNFSLNVFLQWSYGNEIYDANRLIFEGNGLDRPNVNQYASYNNRWTPENQNNELFRAGGQGPLGYYSSRVLEDGSYLRLKTVSFAYKLPKRLSEKVFVKNLSVNVSAQNLYVWTKYKGMDPEVSTRNNTLTPGFDFGAYPQARTIVFGINAGF